ncbi:hypothetical protein [Streptomyces smyrnaeus]|uniref:hypothetical protein n=1 Tax=Streptomyces smyrnaeus TaxID=1387713 RepID=UPI0033F33E1C
MNDGRYQEPYGGGYDEYGRPVPQADAQPLPPHEPWPATAPTEGGPTPYEPYGAHGAYGAHGSHEPSYGPAYGPTYEVTYEVTRIDEPGPHSTTGHHPAPYPTYEATGWHAGALPHEAPATHQPLPEPSGQPRPGTAAPLPPEDHSAPQPMPQPQAQPQHPHPHPHPHPRQPQPQPQPYGAPAAPSQHRQAAPQPQGAPGAAQTTAAPSAPTAPRGARERTGSPIIAPGFQPAAVTTVLAALLAGAAPLGNGALAGALVLLQALTAAGWYRLNGMWPARQGIALAFVAGLTADAGLLLTEGWQHLPSGAPGNAPTVLLGAAGVWCVLSLVLQLRNNSSPDERLYALTAGFAAIGLTVLAAGLLTTEPDAVTLGAAAVAVGTLARAVPLPAPVSILFALAAAAGAGAATGQLSGVDPVPAALIGLGAGVCALLGLRVASYDWPSRFVHMTAGVALPLTLATPAVYLLGRFVL